MKFDYSKKIEGLKVRTTFKKVISRSPVLHALLGIAPMRDFLVGTIVCIAVLYAIDNFWFNGRYSSNVNRMITSLVHHAR